jgi:carboxymethylenebutenolidase
MNKRIPAIVVIATSLAVAYGVGMSHWTGHVMANTPSASAPVAVSAQAGMPMTASGQVARLALEGNIHAGHAMEERLRPALQEAPSDPTLPADDKGAAARLSASQRRGEFAKVDVNGTPVNTWVVYPRGTAKKPVVIVIQEIFGLSDWIRGVADQLAAEGFIAVAPDLLSGHGPNGGDSSSFAGQAGMTQATLALAPAEIASRLKTVREWALKLPNASAKNAVVGFCFGGNQSFAFAVNEPGLNAAVVYYGTAPTDVQPPQSAPPFVPSERLANVKAPILGLYGGADARIDATIPATEMKMKELGKVYEPHVFEGAGHGFLRAQTDNGGANMKATLQAWSLTLSWLKRYTT